MSALSNNIELGIRSRSDSFDDIPEPKTSTWRGRTASTLCPGLGGLLTVAEVGFAIYNFVVNDNNILGGIHTALAVVGCCITTAFWKYYFKAEWNANASSFQDQLRSQKNTVNQLTKELLHSKELNDEMQVEVSRLTEMTDQDRKEHLADLAKEEALNNALRETKEELTKLLPLKEQFESSTRLIQESLKNLNIENADLHRKTQVMQSVIGGLDSFPEALAKKVQALNLEDEGLKEEIVNFKKLVSQFKSTLTKFIEEFSSMQKERDRFKKEVSKLSSESKELKTNVEEQRKIVKQLADSLHNYQELIPELKQIKALAPLFEKKDAEPAEEPHHTHKSHHKKTKRAKEKLPVS